MIVIDLFIGPTIKCENEMDPVMLAIAVVVVFAVTAISVSFLAVMIGLCRNARRKKKEGFKKAYELDNACDEKL